MPIFAEGAQDVSLCRVIGLGVLIGTPLLADVVVWDSCRDSSIALMAPMELVATVPHGVVRRWLTDPEHIYGYAWMD